MKSYLKKFLSVFVFFLFVVFGFYAGRSFARDIVKTPKPEVIYIEVTPLPNIANVPERETISQVDKLCLAKNIYFEAANQSVLGKLAVGIVSMNRVKHHRYPNNVCDVVYQHKQFSWVSDSKPDEPGVDWAWKESLRLSEKILQGDANFIGWDGVTHYHADYVSPLWSSKMKRVAKIDQHVFYQF